MTRDVCSSRMESELPVLPQTLARVLRLTADDSSCFEELLSLAEADPMFALRLVRLANSVQYLRGVGARSAREALSVVGWRTGRELLVGHALCEVFLPRSAFERRLWIHGLQVGVAARTLAGAFGVDPDQAYFAGLIHDVGRFHFLHADADRLARLPASTWCSEGGLEAERRAFGQDHAAAGAALAGAWGLPQELVEVLRHHHAPDAAVGDVRALVELVHQADRLSQSLMQGSEHPYEAAAGAVLERSPLEASQLAGIAELAEFEAASLAHSLGLSG